MARLTSFSFDGSPNTQVARREYTSVASMVVVAVVVVDQHAVNRASGACHVRVRISFSWRNTMCPTQCV
jgi:hypothetical protein